MEQTRVRGHIFEPTNEAPHRKSRVPGGVTRRASVRKVEGHLRGARRNREMKRHRRLIMRVTSSNQLGVFYAKVQSVAKIIRKAVLMKWAPLQDELSENLLNNNKNLNGTLVQGNQTYDCLIVPGIASFQRHRFLYRAENCARLISRKREERRLERVTWTTLLKQRNNSCSVKESRGPCSDARTAGGVKSQKTRRCEAPGAVDDWRRSAVVLRVRGSRFESTPPFLFVCFMVPSPGSRSHVPANHTVW